MAVRVGEKVFSRLVMVRPAPKETTENSLLEATKAKECLQSE
jgi:hypothetical protein